MLGFLALLRDSLNPFAFAEISSLFCHNTQDSITTAVKGPVTAKHTHTVRAALGRVEKKVMPKRLETRTQLVRFTTLGPS